MKCQIARGVRVFITKEEYQFVQDIKGQTPFLLHKLPIQPQHSTTSIKILGLSNKLNKDSGSLQWINNN